VIEAYTGDWADFHQRLGQIIPQIPRLAPGTLVKAAAEEPELPAFCSDPPGSRTLGQELICQLLFAGTSEGRRQIEIMEQRRREAAQSRSLRIAELSRDLTEASTELRSIIDRGRWSVSDPIRSCNVLGVSLYDIPCTREAVVRNIWPMHLWDLARIRLQSAVRSLPTTARTSAGSERSMWFSSVTNWISVAHGASAMNPQFIGSPARAESRLVGLLKSTRRAGRQLWFPFDLVSLFGSSFGYHGRTESIPRDRFPEGGVPPREILLNLPLISWENRPKRTERLPGGGNVTVDVAIPFTFDRIGSVSEADVMSFVMEDTTGADWVGLETKTELRDPFGRNIASSFAIPSWQWMSNYLIEWANEISELSLDDFVIDRFTKYLDYLKQFPEDILGISGRELDAIKDEVLRNKARFAGMTISDLLKAGAAAAGVGAIGLIILGVAIGLLQVVIELLPLTEGCPVYPVSFLLRSPADLECRLDTYEQSVRDSVTRLVTMASRVDIVLENPFDEATTPEEAGFVDPKKAAGLSPILIGGAIGAAALALLIAQR